VKADAPLDSSRLPPAESEALQWLVMRRDGDLSARDERAYQAWFERDAAHRAAVAKMERYWMILGDVGEEPVIHALTERRFRESSRRRRLLRFTGVAASIVIAAGIGWNMHNLTAGNEVPPPVAPKMAEWDQTLRTGVGQRTVINLKDGSIVTLDTDSVLRTRQTDSERTLLLERGRAYFVVAKDRLRPFVVNAEGRTVVATGTEFAVDVEDERGMVVTLVEGRVRVESPGDATRAPEAMNLTPGWQIVAATNLKAEAIDLSRAVSWTTGRLRFYNDTLGAAAQEMNRYSDKKIIISDPEVSVQTLVGSFRAGDIDAFVRAVRLYGFADVIKDTDALVELGPPAG